jgi:hypothetical protein
LRRRTEILVLFLSIGDNRSLTITLDPFWVFLWIGEGEQAPILGTKLNDSLDIAMQQQGSDFTLEGSEPAWAEVVRDFDCNIEETHVKRLLYKKGGGSALAPSWD